MDSLISCRSLLASSAASLAIPAAIASSAAPAKAAPKRLLVERRTVEIDGRAALVVGIRQPDGTPGVVLDPGQPFSVIVENRASEVTIIHWHGQTPPFLQDGVAETGGLPIPSGAVRAYDFPSRPGTHWMHSHHGLQEQALMAAPLIVRTSAELREDVQDVTVLLHDFSFRDPAEVLAAVMGLGKAAPGGVSMPGMAMAPATGVPDLNDYDYDAYLANDRTLTDPLIIRAAPGGRIRLRLINGATSTAFWIDMGALDGTVVAADGNPVRPVTGRSFPLAQGQRLDVMVTIPRNGGAFPILAQREGDRRRTGVVLASAGATIRKLADMAEAAVPPLDNSLEARLAAAARQRCDHPQGRADRVDDALPVVARRSDVGGTRAAAHVEGSSRRRRDVEPHPDGASNAPTRPPLPGGRAERKGPAGGGARHRAGARKGLRHGRVRRRQPRSLALPLPQPLPHGDRDDDRACL